MGSQIGRNACVGGRGRQPSPHLRGGGESVNKRGKHSADAILEKANSKNNVFWGTHFSRSGGEALFSKESAEEERVRGFGD